MNAGHTHPFYSYFILSTPWSSKTPPTIQVYWPTSCMLFWSHPCMLCPICHIIRKLIILTVFGDYYQSWISLFWNFLHLLVTYSFIGLDLLFFFPSIQYIPIVLYDYIWWIKAYTACRILFTQLLHSYMFQSSYVFIIIVCGGNHPVYSHA